MNAQDLYQKKQNIINARLKLQKHGNTYDSTSTACFAFILFALIVAGTGFGFVILKPDNPYPFISLIAYIAAGIFLLFLIVAIIVRLMHNHKRKPILKEKKRLFTEYEQAVRAVLKYEYGLVPVDDATFRDKLLSDTFSDSHSVVIQAMTLDGIDKINLTLQEVDEDALIFTKYGVPYRVNQQRRQELQEQPREQTQELPLPDPDEKTVAKTTGETVSISELFRQERLQDS